MTEDTQSRLVIDQDRDDAASPTDERLMDARSQQPEKTEILIPGEWPTFRSEDGASLRVGHGDFVRDLRPHLPIGQDLFRHGEELKLLTGDLGARKLTRQQAEVTQVLIDDAVELVKRVLPLGASEPVTVFKPCSKALAHIVVRNLSVDSQVPEILSMANHPTWVRTCAGEWTLSSPGHDPDTRHYYDEPPNLDGLRAAQLDPTNPEHRRNVREVLLGDHSSNVFKDFIWRTPSSAVNAVAALLTMLMRPGLKSPVPLFAITSSLPRTGKTLLADSLVRVATGREAEIRQLAPDEAEIKKAIFAALRNGVSHLLFDNARIGRVIDSPALAALITSVHITDRILGHSREVGLPNNTVTMITGNVLALSRELSLRSVAIQLVCEDDHPEARENLPDLTKVIPQVRPQLLSLLHGMIQSWVSAGCQPGPALPLGGFEVWAESVGGVLEHWGIADDFCSNLEEWREECDAESDDIDRFLLTWRERGGEESNWKVTELLNLADGVALFPDVFRGNLASQRTAFSRGILTPLLEVPRRLMDDDGNRFMYRVIRTGSKASKRFAYHLEVCPCAS